MKLDQQVRRILDRAIEARAPTKAECAYLLSFSAESFEAGTTRIVANGISRRRFHKAGLLLGQIGVDVAPCDGGCSFCAFAKPHTQIQESTLSTEESIQRALGFARGRAAGIFIMTMHRFGFDWFLDLVSQMRKAIPRALQLLANVGDIELDQARALKSAGLSGAYHVCRLREGVDTRLSPQSRIRTVEIIREAGLDWYNSCEPIGPEHTPKELAEQIYLGVTFGCRQHAAMRRFLVPGSPLFRHGQLSLARLAQIVAVVALASVVCEETQSIAVHEPNLVGLMSGANALYPEAGEPDQEGQADSSEPSTCASRAGFSSAVWRRSQEIRTDDCRKMLREAGFTRLRRADETMTPLDFDDLRESDLAQELNS